MPSQEELNKMVDTRRAELTDQAERRQFEKTESRERRTGIKTEPFPSDSYVKRGSSFVEPAMPAPEIPAAEFDGAPMETELYPENAGGGGVTGFEEVELQYVKSDNTVGTGTFLIKDA